MEVKRYVEITSEETRMLYNLNFEILKVEHFKGGFEVKHMNKAIDGEKLFLRLDNIYYMVREEVLNGFYGVN